MSAPVTPKFNLSMSQFPGQKHTVFFFVFRASTLRSFISQGFSCSSSPTSLLGGPGVGWGASPHPPPGCEGRAGPGILKLGEKVGPRPRAAGGGPAREGALSSRSPGSASRKRIEFPWWTGWPCSPVQICVCWTPQIASRMFSDLISLRTRQTLRAPRGWPEHRAR